MIVLLPLFTFLVATQAASTWGAVTETVGKGVTDVGARRDDVIEARATCAGKILDLFEKSQGISGIFGDGHGDFSSYTDADVKIVKAWGDTVEVRWARAWRGVNDLMLMSVLTGFSALVRNYSKSRTTRKSCLKKEARYTRISASCFSGQRK